MINGVCMHSLLPPVAASLPVPFLVRQIFTVTGLSVCFHVFGY